jgi:hypothetical protein
MRTKSLLLTAAVIAAGISASQAQVYSVNSVGYVNQSIPAGYTMIANPLNTTNNTIGVLLPDLPSFSSIYKWNETTSQFDIATIVFGTWDHPEYTLNPGEGAFVNTDTPFSITWVGEVRQGNLTNTVPAGYSIRASQVPQAGSVSTLGLTVGDFDSVYKWNNGANQYDIYTYVFGSWGPSEPVIGVAESFFINAGAPFTWNRSFSVN